MVPKLSALLRLCLNFEQRTCQSLCPTLRRNLKPKAKATAALEDQVGPATGNEDGGDEPVFKVTEVER